MTDRPPTALPGCSVLPPMTSSKPTADPTPKATRGPPKDKPTDKVKGKPKGDRFPMLNRFIDFTIRELDRNEIAVWLILFRDTREGIAATGQTDIARRAGVAARTVRRVISKLAARGLVQVVRRGSIGAGNSTYRVSPLVDIHTADKAVSGYKRTN